MLAKIIRVRHRMQGGRSVGKSNTSVSERGMSLTTSQPKLSSERSFFCTVADKSSQRLREDFFRNVERLLTSKVWSREVSRGRPLWPAA